jgi:hypothetical protein
MTLTIPKAGVIAGRAAQLTPQQPGIVGAGLSALGEGMAQMGAKYTADKLDYQGKKLQIDIARDLSAARLEAEQLGDPQAVGAMWDGRKAEIQKKYFEGVDANGEPLVPEALRAGIELTLGELDNRHTDALARKSADWVQSKNEATWIELSDQIAIDASQSDPETAAALLEVSDNLIDQRVASGEMMPAEGAKQKAKQRETVYGARATSQIEADPEAFLADAKRGDYDALGAEKKATRMATAQAEIYRRVAAEEKATEVAASARQAAIGKRLGEMTDLYADGFKVVDDDRMVDPEVMAHPDYPRAAAARSLQLEIPGLRQMTPAQINQMIEAERSAPKAHKYQTERVKQLETWAEASAQRWATDGKAVAAEAGMKPPALEFDPENPQGFATALNASIAYDAKLRADGFPIGQAIFTGKEAANIARVLDPKADAGPKVALAQSIAAGAGQAAPRVIAAMQADPVFARTTRLIQSTNDPDLAEAILRGQQKAELKTVTMPAPRMMQQAFDAVTGGAFDGNPTLKAEMLAAAAALYADGATGIDPETQSGSGWIDDSTATDLFAKSIQRVTGARADQNGELTVGGVQEINGGFVSLPVGVPMQAVETALDDIGAHLRGQRRTAQGWDSSATATPPDPMRALRAASIDGRIPDLGANPENRLAEFQLQRVLSRTGEETDQFRFVKMRNGTAYPVGDASGVEYRFRLPALIREAAK